MTDETETKPEQDVVEEYAARMTLTPADLALGARNGWSEKTLRTYLAASKHESIAKTGWSLDEYDAIMSTHRNKPGVTLADWEASRGRRDHEGNRLRRDANTGRWVKA